MNFPNHPKIKPVPIQKYSSGKNLNRAHHKKYSTYSSQESKISSEDFLLSKQSTNILTSQHQLSTLHYEFNPENPLKSFPTSITYFFSKIKTLSSLKTLTFQLHIPKRLNMEPSLQALMISLASLKNLTHLNIHIFFRPMKDTKLLKTLFKYLIRISSLTNLSLSFSKCDHLSTPHLDLISSYLTKLLQLRSLNLSFCSLFKHYNYLIRQLNLTLPNLPLLSKFTLRINGITVGLKISEVSALFSCFKALKGLSDLALDLQKRYLTHDANMTEPTSDPVSEGLALLDHSKIRRLSLQLYKNFNENFLAQLTHTLKNFTSLHTLHLDFSVYPDFNEENGAAFSLMLSSLVGLSSLRIILPSRPFDGGILKYLTPSLKSLKNLINFQLKFVGSVCKIDNDEIKQFFSEIRCLKSLRFLDLDSCHEGINDENLETLGESLKELTLLRGLSLGMEFAYFMTNQGIEALACGIKTLVNLSGLTLSVGSNNIFDNKTVDIITNMLHNLHRLYSVDFSFVACPKMTNFEGLFRELKRENIGEIAINISRQAKIPKESTSLMNSKIVKRMYAI